MAKNRLFNDGWEFAKLALDTSRTTVNAVDTVWVPVDLPHDWLIYDTKNLYEDGEGWYRRRFARPVIAAGSRVAVRFDGIYIDSTVFVNDAAVGEWKYGYTSFEIDITDYLIPDGNELKVRVAYRAPNSRWYSGAGIYRNVWLKTMPADHLVSDGVYASAVKMENGWQVEIDTELSLAGAPGGAAPDNAVGAAPTAMKGSPDLAIRHTLVGADGKTAASAEAKVAAATSTAGRKPVIDTQMLAVRNPALWGTENPALYTLKTELIADGAVIDMEERKFGFRTLRFDPDRGFFLNDAWTKLRGVCQHHDLGCLGAAVNRTALRRQLEILKTMGVNAVRTSHNPPAVELMELADEMGILIVSEVFDMWENPKTTYDYARFFKDWVARDVASWIRRDRNHPSVIMWSIGNEISDTHASERGQVLTRELMEMVHRHDFRGNAPVTIGSNYMPWEGAQKCAEIVKLAGYNYAEKYYAKHHAEHRDWIIYGSETSSIVQSRGIYHFPATKSLLADDDEQCSSLGNSATSWGARSMEACICDDRDASFSPGQFLWSGFDYIGEPTPYHTKNSYFGQIDTCGFPKDAYYVYRAEWTDYRESPMVHIFPYWDFNDGQLIDIRVCSNAPRIELFFNDESLGTYDIDHAAGRKLIGEWRLPYRPGTLKAVAYDETGAVIATDFQRSFGEAAKIILRPDKTALAADGRDLAFIDISMADRDGNPVENANNRVAVSVSGAGRLVGLDNGDSTDFDQYKGTSRRLFSGRLLAVIAAKLEAGEIQLEVASAGLPTEYMTLTALPTEQLEGVSALMENVENNGIVEIPVRKIVLTSLAGQKLNADLPRVRVKATLLPENASFRDVEWRAANDVGIDSDIALVEAEGLEATVTALGDGAFRLRCSTRNGADTIRLMSQLEFEASGLGRAYLNPYKFISGGLYNASNCELGNGNERGVATWRDGVSHVGFKGVDFGGFGSDEVTIPIFALDSQEFPIELWEGMPEEAGSVRLTEVSYQKPSIWNTYQEATYKLPKRLKGITTFCLVLNRKIHIKGFQFVKQEKAYAQLSAAENDRIYGDTFTVLKDAVEGIGNNVTLEYGDMDFGAEGLSGIVICGRSPIPKNTIQMKFEGEDGATVQIAEFPYCGEYVEKEYRLEKAVGLRKVSFVFLPGSRFDFKWFRFLRKG